MGRLSTTECTYLPTSVAWVQVRKMERESKEPFSDRSRGHQSDQGLCLHTSAQDTPPHGEGRG